MPRYGDLDALKEKVMCCLKGKAAIELYMGDEESSMPRTNGKIPNFKDGYQMAFDDAIKIVNKLFAIENNLTVDAAEVVRCKRCKYWESPDGVLGVCNKINIDNFFYTADWFCKGGERRNDG